MRDFKERKIPKNSTELVLLNQDNCSFYENHGFIALTFKKGEETKEYVRVFLHRCFPFQELFEYIAVLDDEYGEIGIIKDINIFKEDTKKLLVNELERKYYEPQIETILSVKERYGFSYWVVTTVDGRKVNFTMQDTFRNIIRVGDNKAILLDVDGNRFVINDIEKLPKKSRKKIELYL